MKNFPGIDPFTYKRPNKWVTNPLDYMKLKQAHSKFPSIPFENYKQAYIESKYNIPSEASLANMKRVAEQFRSSEAVRPIRKGYEFKILKN